MYECTECPKCSSRYRFPLNGPLIVVCDDCGFEEEYDEHLKKLYKEEDD
jgi:hypothetical protein